MNLPYDNILEIIPQRDPMVMIHRLIEANENSAITELDVKTNNIFFENNKLTEPALIENMAQTVAAQNGFLYKKAGKDVPQGFIGAVSKLSITRLPTENETITTKTKLITQALSAHIISAQVFVKDEVIANAELKVFVEGL